MDGIRVFALIVLNDDEVDVQIFQTRLDAQRYGVSLVLDYLSQHEELNGSEDYASWPEVIDACRMTKTKYEMAHMFLNDMDIQDLAMEIVERHIFRKEDE